MIGVYISYPFCAQKCSYCNFASGVFPRALEKEYVDALIRETNAYQFPGEADTLYLGGGTPSTMDRDNFARLLQMIPGHPWREATLEAAPGSFEPHHVAHWRDCGINRVSLGVQSFVTGELRRTGRKHTAEIVAADIATLRAAGMGNINIDLIAGLPGQTAESWRQSLEWIEELAVPHVSVYMLEVDDDSRLGREMLGGGVRYGAGDVPDEGAIADMYETAVAELARFGLARYEISNFARPGCESLHNLKYWKREPYVGFGADAHSYVDGLRWSNTESVEEYIARSPAAQSPVTPAAEDEERFFVGLRLTEGIELLPEDWVHHGETIGRFLQADLMARSGTKLRLTSRGVMISNDILSEFLAA